MNEDVAHPDKTIAQYVEGVHRPVNVTAGKPVIGGISTGTGECDIAFP